MKYLLILCFVFAMSTAHADHRQIHAKHVIISGAATAGLYYTCRHVIGIDDKFGCLFLSSIATFMAGAAFEYLQNDNTPHMPYDILANGIGITLIAIPITLFD